ncbi:MAG: hypothetical protein LC804_13365, partial [Acidobacteria bacterium]|nr:hypothetical protein [Acidobacteriota bacterium]
MSSVADHLGGLRPDLCVAIPQELRELARVLFVLPRELREPPQRVNPAETVRRIDGGGKQRGGIAATYQLELRALPDAHVNV